MNRSYLFVTFMLLSFYQTATAQIVIEGKVISSDTNLKKSEAGLPGVTIMIKGTAKGTMSDASGKFIITLSKDELKQMDSAHIVLTVAQIGLLSDDLEYKQKKGTAIISMGEGAKISYSKEKNYATTTVYFATDRNVTTNQLPSERFGPSRAPSDSAPMSYGYCNISIPREHEMGDIERPSLWKFEFNENPAKHIVILKTKLQDKSQFFSSLKSSIAGSSPEKNALLFFHGYNVSFDEAARRTAQLSYDVGFIGTPLFYSWPSNGKTLDYLADVGNITWSTSHMQTFLNDFMASSEAQNIYIIAHSMGNQGLTRALAEVFKLHPEYRSKVREVILAAPDIDASIFKTEIAPGLMNLNYPITLYASSRDRALIASQEIQQYPRLGQSGEGIVILPGLETIDVSDLRTDFLGHSYVVNSDSIIGDIYYLIKDHKRAKYREGMVTIGIPDKMYYKFRK